MAPSILLDPAILAFADRLVADADRSAAAQALARHLGGEDLIVFVPDPHLDLPLPALGFPQTLPGGRLWHRFLRDCRIAGYRAGELPSPRGGEPVSACGVAGADGSVLILLGVRDQEPDLAPVRALLPLLAAVFARERAALALASRVTLASQMAAQAHTLTEALDGARRDLQHALAGAEAAREREAFLGNVGATLDASLDYAETLQGVARLVVPTFADYCIVELLEADRSLRPVAVAHRDSAQDDLLWEYRRRYPVTQVQREATVGLVERGEGQLFAAITEEMLRGMAADAAHLAVMQALAPSSCVVAPLVTRGRVFGILSCVRTDGRPAYAAADLQFAEKLAHRAALAIENARLYSEAQEAIAVRDQFLSVAAHELRTPVTSIKGYAQFLQRRHAARTLGDEQLARYLGVVSDASDRLDRLTRDLLDSARIRTGRLAFNVAPVDLAAWLGEVLARYREQAGGHHAFVIERWDAPCAVSVDAERIEQVLTNLLENAVKYSAAGTAITLSLACDAEGVCLSVRDEGIGLPTGAEEAIFEPFTRAANAEERRVPGFGLGLSICRRIAEGHGGRLWAESAGIDRGARFMLWLPRVARDGASPDEREQDDAADISPVHPLTRE
jgi:signal transduction histidine kinase